MKSEKAIKNIVAYVYAKFEKLPQDVVTALSLAQKALELQIPKKPKYGYDEQEDILCPNCKESVGFMDSYSIGRDNYCSNCSQALDWK